MATPQQLHARNLSPDPEEELACRVKDPLWFLARQWQSGEFEAENGGRPDVVTVKKVDHQLTHLRVSGDWEKLDLAEPVDRAVEAESDTGDSPAWSSEALEYEAELRTAGRRLVASEYHGGGLEWWHFDVAGPDENGGEESEEDRVRMTPSTLHFRGAPHPRWWRIEDGDAYFDAPEDPEPNALSTLLPEFFYLDVENWLTLPLPIISGSLREIREVSVADSFDVVETLGPAASRNGAWRVFQLAGSEEETWDGRWLFVPHVAHNVLENNLVEEVRLHRDEQSNLIWAVEKQYTDANGEVVVNGDKARMSGDAGTSPSVSEDHDGTFRLQSETPDWWIPYVPRFETTLRGQPSGDIYLRRGRTRESATPDDTQYKSRIVGESVRLAEEEIGELGLRIRRVRRSVRGSDGEVRHWIGRRRDVTEPIKDAPDLRFDYVFKKGQTQSRS
jgi:hypothetical protein